MTSKIVNYILSFTAIGKYLDGKKTIIGAAFIVAASVLELLQQLAPMFPEYAFLGDAAKGLGEGIEAAKHAAGAIGMPFLYAGLLHKAAKKEIASK